MLRHAALGFVSISATLRLLLSTQVTGPAEAENRGSRSLLRGKDLHG